MAGNENTREATQSRGAAFDEQMWPINCAIVILAGFVAGRVLVRSDFTDARVLYNGYSHILGVILLVALLFWGVWWLQGKVLRRLQLAILLSLIAHAAVAFYVELHPMSIYLPHEARDRPGGGDQPEEFVAPDYYWAQVEQPDEEQGFEAPVQAVVPEAVSPPPLPLAQEDLTRSAPPEVASTAAAPELPPGGPGAEPAPNELRRAGASTPQPVEQTPQRQFARQTGRDIELPQAPAEAAPAPPSTERGKAIDAGAVAVGRQQGPDQPGALGRPAAGDPGPAGSAVAARGEMPRRAGDPTADTISTQLESPGRAGRDVVAAINIAPAPGEPPATQAGPPGEPGKAPGQPGDTAIAKASTKPVAGGPGTLEPGQSLAGMTTAPQLPAGLARRSAGAQPQTTGQDAIIGRPGTLARADNGGINMPSTALPSGDDPAVAPPAWGGMPGSRVEAASTVAVERSATSRAPSGAAIAAAGSAEFGIGGGQRITRTGMPRGAGEGRPSVAPNSNVRRLARAPSGTSIGGIPAVDIEARPEVLSEPGPGDGIAPSALASSVPGAGGARVGTPGMPSRTVGIGTSADGGLPGASGVGTPLGPVGLAELGRVPRQAVAPLATVTGGTGEGGGKRPGRATLGGGLPDATADAGGFAANGLGGTGGGGGSGSGSGIVPGVALEGNVAGLEPGVAGLPGSIQTAVRMGALASSSDRGAPLAMAAGRRATASQPRDGGSGVSPSMAGTLARTQTGGGVHLPSAAVPTAPVATLGAGGVMTSPGGAGSSLQVGPVATVNRGAAPSVPFSGSAIPVGYSEAGSGSALTPMLPGTISGTGTGVPRVGGAEGAGAAVGPMALARSNVSGAGVPGGVAQGGEAASAGAAPSGPSAGAGGGSIEPGPSATANVIRARAGLPGSGTGAGGLPGGVGPDPRLPSGGNAETEKDTGVSLAGAGTGVGANSIGPRRIGQGSDQGGPLGAAGGLTRATRNIGLPGGTAEPIQPQAVAIVGNNLNPGAGATIGRGLGGPNPNGTGAGGTGPGALGGDGRATGPGGRGGLTVQPAGLGPGLGEVAVAGVSGLPARRGLGETAQAVAANGTGRLALNRSGGGLAIEGSIKEPMPGYQHRGAGRRRGFGPGEGEGSGTNDKILEGGLDFFARVQFPDGHWSLDKLPDGMKIEDAALGQMQSDTAATGLALLTYFGGGYTHLDDKHRMIVRRGVDWLVKRQKPNGDLFVGGSKYTHLYSHGIAAIALCEAYGMTQDPELREPAQKAIDFIVASQEPRLGGWRYEPGKESDTSVTGWQLMALKSGQMAGLTVPVETLRKINGWLDRVQAPERDGRSVYNPYDNPTRADSFRPSLAMTAEAMLMRMYLGQRRDNPAIVRGAEHLRRNLPEVGSTDRPQRDCYYWYYATQAMYQMQGDYWASWNNRLRSLMEASQVKTGDLAGTWHPNLPLPDRWGHAGGRLYVTAMHLLMLEVEYRYLPLFQELSK